MAIQYLDLTIRERTAVIVFALAEGQTFSTAEVARRVNITRQGAWYLLNAISRLLPITQDDEGIWRRVVLDEISEI